MNLIELKDNIVHNELSDNFMIFCYAGDNFLVNQYIKEISTITGKELKSIESLAEVKAASNVLFAAVNNNLNILRVDNFEEICDNYDIFTNTIVVCKKIDKSIKDRVANYIIKFSDTEDWQILDYMKQLCPGVHNVQLFEVLLKSLRITGSDKKPIWSVYKIENELTKVSLFPHEYQEEILLKLIEDDESDLLVETIFKLVDGIMERDYTIVNYLLTRRFYCDFEPLALVTNLIRKFKYIILFNNALCGYGNSGNIAVNTYAYKEATACLHYSKDEIKRNIEFLSGIDRRLKMGELDIGSQDDKDLFLSYIVCNVMAK